MPAVVNWKPYTPWLNIHRSPSPEAEQITELSSHYHARALVLSTGGGSSHGFAISCVCEDLNEMPEYTIVIDSICREHILIADVS